MKVLVLVATVFLIAGCGSFTSMEQLERQALLTGDWSAVERRERIIERRKMQRGPVCPTGQVAVCESMVNSMRCSCVESDAISSILAGR